ncbi:MAG: hypothetical protein FWE71_17525 [Nocardioidaceae bacterium]|nr:hypothetical protein [Nocardioidaceae bacterium]
MLAAASLHWAERVSAPATLPARLPKEFHGPVGYSDRWFWLAALALLLAAAYYLAALWFTRDRPEPPPPPVPLPDLQSEHLARIDAVVVAVRDGRTSARDGHQQLSEVVRAYVERITPLHASTMTLADLRAHAPRPLADMIEVMYPPEFAPDDDGEAAERFDNAVQQARGLVGTWRR